MTEHGTVMTWFPPFFGGLVFAIGVPGNLLVLRVFLDRRLNQPVHVIFVVFALADLLVCLCRMIILYLSLARQDAPAVATRCRVSDASLFFSVYLTAFLLTTLAVERYTTFCKPRRFKNIALPTYFVLAICFFGALILSSTLPLLGKYEEVKESRFCDITSRAWLIDLRFYSLAGLTVIAFPINAWLCVAISRAIRHRVRVGGDGLRNRSRLSLVSVATRVSLTVPQIPSLAGPVPVLPPRPFQGIASSSHDESLSHCPNPKDKDIEPGNSKCHELNKDSTRPKHVRFDEHCQIRLGCSDFSSSKSNRPPSCHPPPSPKISDNDLARMMFAKLIVFSVTWIPPFILMVLERFAVSSLDVWLAVCLHLVLVNSAVNIVIFAIASLQFRAEYRDLFKTIRCFWEPRFERNRAIHLNHLY